MILTEVELHALQRMGLIRFKSKRKKTRSSVPKVVEGLKDCGKGMTRLTVLKEWKLAKA